MTLGRRYWDSDCFLGWLQAEEGKIEPCRQVLNLAAKGDVEIVTSALTIAEVLHIKGRQPITADKRQQVTDFFKRSYIIAVSITRRIAEESREYVWDHGIDPKDALHVATAISAKVDVFNTFDRALIGKSLAVGNPKLLLARDAAADRGRPPVPRGAAALPAVARRDHALRPRRRPPRRTPEEPLRRQGQGRDQPLQGPRRDARLTAQDDHHGPGHAHPSRRRRR